MTYIAEQTTLQQGFCRGCGSPSCTRVHSSAASCPTHPHTRGINCVHTSIERLSIQPSIAARGFPVSTRLSSLRIYPPYRLYYRCARMESNTWRRGDGGPLWSCSDANARTNKQYGTRGCLYREILLHTENKSQQGHVLFFLKLVSKQSLLIGVRSPVVRTYRRVHPAFNKVWVWSFHDSLISFILRIQSSHLINSHPAIRTYPTEASN